MLVSLYLQLNEDVREEISIVIVIKAKVMVTVVVAMDNNLPLCYHIYVFVLMLLYLYYLFILVIYFRPISSCCLITKLFACFIVVAVINDSMAICFILLVFFIT